MKNVLEKEFVGVDCHKDTIACYVNGKFKEFKTNFKGFKKALEWAGKDCNWAVEGAYSHGIMLSAFLLDSGCKVYEFNALATAKARKALNVSGEKNDYGDAKVISIFAKHFILQEVSLKTVELKRKITARKLLVKQRTELTNSIKSSTYKTGLVLPFDNLNTQKAIKWLLKQDDLIIQSFTKVLKEINETINNLEEEIKTELPKQAEKLLEITGISYLTAATIYTELKGKKMTKAQLASYCAVSPVENSSGKTTNFRNNKRGNRILNSILYSISVQQSRFDEIGSQYFMKKLQEGKSRRHARKCLSRQICNLIWKALFKD